jgi:hypothetical protein
MIDACALAATARCEAWHSNLDYAEKLHLKKPKSKAFKSKYENAKRMVEFYSRQKQALLDFLEPSTIARVWSDTANEYVCYIGYDIGSRHFDVVCDRVHAVELIERYDLDVVDLDEAPSNSYPAGETVSYYFVNRVISTMQIYDFTYQDTGNFNPMQKNYVPASGVIVRSSDDKQRDLYVNLDAAVNETA